MGTINVNILKENLQTLQEEYAYLSLPQSGNSLAVGTLRTSKADEKAERGIEQLFLFFHLEEDVSSVLKAKAHVENVGDTQEIEVKNDILYCLGEQGKRLEGIYLSLTPETAQKYTLRYRVHEKGDGKTLGECQWVTEGNLAGTKGQSRPIDEIQVELLHKNPFDTAYFRQAVLQRTDQLKEKKEREAARPGMLRAGREETLGQMSIPEPLDVKANNDMPEEEYKACSMIIAVCKNMIQKTITETAQRNGIGAADALKNMDSWVKGFTDFPFPFFDFESMQEQDYKNDEFVLNTDPQIMEAIVNIENVPALKKAVISALTESGNNGNIASYSNTEKDFTYFGVITGYEAKCISMRVISFTMHMKNTEVKSLCGGVTKTHLDSHYCTYLFTADKEMMIKMQSKVKDKMLDTISAYLMDFIEEFYGEQYERFKQELARTVN